MSALCPRCTAPVSDSARFCGSCGVRLQRGTAAPQGERRILTLMFADLVGSTRLAAQLGVEEYTDLMDRFHRIGQAQVRTCGGRLLQHYGDGLLAAFGMAEEAEDAAGASIAAALALAERIPDELDGARVRIGLHAGAVLCRIGGGELIPQVTGLDVNIAARVAESAGPGMVRATAPVLRAAQRVVRVTADPLSQETFRGFDTPVSVARVEALSGPGEDARTGLAERDGVLRSILTGRIGTTRTRAFLVEGAAGMGKSALRAELVARSGATMDLIQIDSRSNLTRSPLYPLTVWLQDRFGSEEEQARLALRLDRDHLEALAEARGAAPAGNDGATASLRRTRRIEALVALLHQMMTEAPTTMHVDDVHWMDDDSRSVIAGLLARGVPEGSRLVLYARPDTGIAESFGPAALSVLSLAPLSDSASARLLEAEGEALDAATRARIIETAAGNPLYLRALREAARNNGGTLPGQLPPSIEATLQSNIAATGELRHVLQAAALIGRGASLPLIAALTGTPPETLRAGLDSLAARGLVDCSGAEVAFTHPLLRDAAYEMLPPGHRRSLHGRLVPLLQDLSPDLCATLPEWLADHALQSDQPDLCIAPCIAAGFKFLAAAHFDLAERYLEAAEEALARDPARAQERVQVLTLLASARVQRLGFAHPDVERAYRHLETGLEGAEMRSGDRMRALYGLFAHRIISGQVRTCVPMVRQMALTADPAQPHDRLMHLVNVTALHFYSGRFDRSLAAAAEVEAIYDPDRDGRLFLELGADPLISVLSARCHILIRRGALAEGHAAHDRAVAHMAHLSSPGQDPWLKVVSGMAEYATGQDATARRNLTAAIELADRQGAAFWSLVARIWEASYDCRDNVPDAPERLTGLLAGADAVGLGVCQPYFWSSLALAHHQQGRSAEALALSERAVRRIAATGEGMWGAEVWEDRARILAAHDPTGAARALRLSQAFRTRSGTIGRPAPPAGPATVDPVARSIIGA
ncbi:AAA family ATPase [Pseudooceanicola sp. CBS1P-1]|uniref:AAA family ATPase n=1 Tax=Pseudooceanicola albus TaxID=2692189 RepID=A0A6L7G3J5_9RHOB|nr:MULTISPECIES: adenylate/guanylate cyclase domain-containing protein [Pseudooceanicola]MBT9385127.1 AAA family ATPase [Pseudooceanicola endophyticus]MXN18581.1 AAA family ATPase [Pseudooceanicola albus]